MKSPPTGTKLTKTSHTLYIVHDGMAERVAVHATSPSSTNQPGGLKSSLPGPNLTVNDVYSMTTRIAQEIQAVVSVYGTVGLQELVELVVRSLEYLEHYVAETERLNTENCRMLLDLDKLMVEKESHKLLRSEFQVYTYMRYHIMCTAHYSYPHVQAMKLVLEERGRQRDALALRVGELEVTNQKLVQQVYEMEKAQSKVSLHGGSQGDYKKLYIYIYICMC